MQQETTTVKLIKHCKRNNRRTYFYKICEYKILERFEKIKTHSSRKNEDILVLLEENFKGILKFDTMLMIIILREEPTHFWHCPRILCKRILHYYNKNNGLRILSFTNAI